VGSAPVIWGPVLEVTAAPAEARRLMAENDTDWVGLLDRGRLLGWVDSSLIDGTPLSELEPRPFLVTLSAGSSLREALDAVVVGHARVAMVVDDGFYKGMLDLERIAGEVTE
jgi:hypothetical protein